MVYLGVLVSALAFFIYNFALGHIGVGRISLYLVLIAPLGVPLAAIFLGETVNLQDGVAIALVIVGVALPSLASQPWLVSLWPGRSGRRRMPR
jgi:drug/metabolite transporter (DMT)-like permease